MPTNVPPHEAVQEPSANRAWVLWRIECHRDHQQRVFDHFRSLGLELARPIYTSSEIFIRSDQELNKTFEKIATGIDVMNQ